MITPKQGVVIAQRYTLVRPLASGGMGSVWIARHRDLEVDVTVKFMAPSLIASAEARGRFEREAKAAARLDSQHVVHVYDYGVEDDTPYMVMELLKGESLWERLSREGQLPLPMAARQLVQICKALRTAHEAGLVHRDLKPGNIFLARKDEDEVVKILDFGIAKTSDIGDAQAHTESGVLLGSVHYMSPEQIRSSRGVDHRADLWSIAVILYRMLGGCLPFPGEKLGDVLVRVCTEEFPPLSSMNPDLPAGADAFFARALDRDPDRRFQSAMEMAEAFSAMALATPLSVSSRPPPPEPPPPLRQRWKKTIPMSQFQALPEAHPSAAIAAQPAVEASSGTIRGVLVDSARSEPSQAQGPGAIGGRGRAWWPALAAVAAVALVAIVGVGLDFGQRSTAVSAPVTSDPSLPVTMGGAPPNPPAQPAATVTVDTAGDKSASQLVEAGAPPASSGSAHPAEIPGDAPSASAPEPHAPAQRPPPKPGRSPAPRPKDPNAKLLDRRD